MDFKNKNVENVSKKIESSPFISKLKKECSISPLLMYSEPPDGTIEFEEFASLALNRFAGICTLCTFYFFNSTVNME
jgi:hypothetical protein